MAAPATENREKVFFAELLKTLVSTIEEKDEFIRGHSDRVANACKFFATKLNLPKKAIDRLYLVPRLRNFAICNGKIK